MSAVLAGPVPMELPLDLALQVGRSVATGDAEDLAYALRLLDRRAAARRDGRWDDVEIVEDALRLGCVERQA